MSTPPDPATLHRLVMEMLLDPVCVAGDADSTIGDRLNVQHVLEGSIRQQGDVVRVTARLTAVETGSNVWSKTFDGSLNDVFGIQEEISRSVVDELRVRLLGDEGDDVVFITRGRRGGGAEVTGSTDPGDIDDRLTRLAQSNPELAAKITEKWADYQAKRDERLANTLRNAPDDQKGHVRGAIDKKNNRGPGGSDISGKGNSGRSGNAGDSGGGKPDDRSGRGNSGGGNSGSSVNSGGGGGSSGGKGPK
ncbi:MAG: hypothetical protein IH960_06740 [Chloroflexi bacterium]|nr:hypothetical protein [Chloroflexota bacterium]